MTIEIENKKCTGCAYCYIVCPTEAISLKIEERVSPVIDTDICTRCG